MVIELKEHFTYKKLIRFTVPSVLMVILTSVYSIVDGFFVANFAGKTPFAALNFVWPFIMFFGALGFMFGIGGSALISKVRGEGDEKRANQIFSMLIYTIIGLGVVFALLGALLIKPVLLWFGLDGQFLVDSLTYAYILFAAVPVFMLQFVFQEFLVAAERPKFGFWVNFGVGVTNVGLDALFICVFHWGIAGAAWATLLGMVVGGVVPLIYFFLPNKSPFRLGKTFFDGKALLKVCTNGISEFVSNISAAVVVVLYNYQMLKFIGEGGVAAFGVISYINFIFWAVFLGYSFGVSPIISYHFGAQNKKELHSLFVKSLVLITGAGIVLTLFAEILTVPLVKIFIGYDDTLLDMTISGFRIYAISFLFSGFNFFASAFFTALNNGVISAIISGMRTLVLESLCVLILPLIFGLNGIWGAIIVAEFLALLLSFLFFKHFRNRYGY